MTSTSSHLKREQPSLPPPPPPPPTAQDRNEGLRLLFHRKKLIKLANRLDSGLIIGNEYNDDDDLEVTSNNVKEPLECYGSQHMIGEY